MSELESIAKLRRLPFHGTNGLGNCVTASKETINSILGCAALFKFLIVYLFAGVI